MRLLALVLCFLLAACAGADIAPQDVVSQLAPTGRLRAAVDRASVMATTDLPLDPSSATAAGIKDEFVRRLRDGEAKLVDAVPGAATQRSTWLYDVPVTPDGASTLSDLGAQLLVMPFGDYTRLGGSLRDFNDATLLQTTVLPNGSSMAVAVVDPMMALLEPDAEPDTTPAAKAVQLMAEISTMRLGLEPDRRSLIVATPDLDVDGRTVKWRMWEVDVRVRWGDHREVTVATLRTVAGDESDRTRQPRP